MYKARISVSVFFFNVGFLYAGWTSRLPELQQFWSVNNAELGTLLFIMALGALISMPFAGNIVQKFGGPRFTPAATYGLCTLLAFVPWIQSLWLIGLLFLVFGLVNGSLDVAINEQAVYVERLWGRPIMSSFHAVFSIGMTAGAALGALCAKMHIPLTWQLDASALTASILAFLAAPHLIPGDKPVGQGAVFRLPSKAILPLGIIAFCCMTAEGAMADWSALYMNKVIGSPEALSAFALGSFSIAMTAGRVVGDYFTRKLGKWQLLTADSLIAISGLATALIFQSPWSTLAGFFLVGAGLSTIVPIVYSSAGNTPGVAPGVGIAMATTIGYAGFFIGPPLIGLLGDAFGLRIALLFVLLLLSIMALLVVSMKRKK